MKRSQVGIEYVMLLGVLLIFFIPIIHYSLTKATTNVKEAQLENAVRRLSKAADTVYAMGPGAQEIVAVTLPPAVQATKVHHNEIVFVVTGFGGTSDIHAGTKAQLIGNLPTLPGTYHMVVQTLPNNTVNISTK